MASVLPIPQPIRDLFAAFPLHTYPTPASPFHAARITSPTLWIHPPALRHTATGSGSQLYNNEQDLLSSDVECLKWQAYLALRYLKGITVRWDVSPEGGVDGRLPNLHVPLEPESKGSIQSGIKDDGEGELLAAHLIPEWVDRKGGDVGLLEGYTDEAARDESRAWVSLLEGNVHAALLAFQPKDRSFLACLAPYHTAQRTIESVLNPPPAPLTGWSSVIRPFGVHLDLEAIETKYQEAIAALSDRLGTDRWFLGSAAPTALDALAFAYLHTILNAKQNNLRFEVSRRVNLVAWEQRVSRDVRAAFKPYTRSS